MKDIVIVGAGTVGAELASLVTRKQGDHRVTLIDIQAGLAEGVALDLRHAAAMRGIDTPIGGGTTWEGVDGADVIIVTSGTARRPQDKSRDDLLRRNAAIVREVAAAAFLHAPNAVVVLVTNPVDVLCSLFAEAGFPTKRILGMGGVLDSGRFRSIIAEVSGRRPSEVRNAMVLGRHGELMVPIFTRVRVGDGRLALSAAQIEEVVRRTIGAGHEIVTLLQTRSTQFGPAQATWKMVDAVLRNIQVTLPAMVASNGAYGTLEDEFIGLPVVVGRHGVELIEAGIALSPDELRGLRQASEDVAEQRRRLSSL
jgi:malate dehydrogenase